MIPNAYRKQVTSATYFLVLACGMSIERAEEMLDADISLVRPLADAGSRHWQGCERALLTFIEKAVTRGDK